MKNWLWVAVAMVGCGSQMVEPDAGTIERVEPRIVARSPNTIRVVYEAGDCTQPVFSLMVTADSEATVRSRWFIDEDGLALPHDAVSVPPGSALRKVTAPSSAVFRAAMNNLTVGVHTLSAYVTDSEFAEAQHHTTLDGRAVDQQVWVLDVRPCL